MVEIKGLEKFASRDFPGHISATVFLGGCNFRCPFCHNADLVLAPGSLETIPFDFFLAFLDGRQGWLEGVCFSGGEPFLHGEVEALFRVVKERGLLVKADTNGSFPDRLERAVRDGLLDWAAMDIKAPLERYREVARVDVDVEAVARSADVLRTGGLRHIFRTTVVPGLVGRADIVKIGEWLEGADEFWVQAFLPRTTLDPSFSRVPPYPPEELAAMVEAARPYFKTVRLEAP